MQKPSGIFQYEITLNQANSWLQTHLVIGADDALGNRLRSGVVPTSLVAADGLVNANQGGPPIVVVWSPLNITPADAADQLAVVVELDLGRLDNTAAGLTAMSLVVSLANDPADNSTGLFGYCSVIVPDGQNRAL